MRSNLLDRVEVVSAISGGALLAAAWAYGPPQFTDFDALATDLLHRGVQRQLVAWALSPVWSASSTRSQRLVTTKT